MPAFLGWEDPGAAFTAITQLGTWPRCSSISARTCGASRGRSFGAFATRRSGATRTRASAGTSCSAPIPIAIFGLAFRDQIEDGARDLYLIGTTLIVLGLVLLVAEKVGPRERRWTTSRRGTGSSWAWHRRWRSCRAYRAPGATITAGLFLGFDRAAAARFSFLLSVPAVVLSGLFEMRDFVGGDGHDDTGIAALIVATAFAFVVGYASIAFLLRYLASHSTYVFVGYRVAAGNGGARARRHGRDPA